MPADRKIDSLLGPFRVLDLTDEKGLLCTKTLADLGAEVIKIEKPCGDHTRTFPPFYHGIPDPEKSLYWFTYNTSKKGITLDIESPDGREIFKKLVETADFVIECFDPGYMASLGLGYSDLSKVNPRIVVTSITPFGQEGPYSSYKGSDIICLGMGGIMYIIGDPDRPPVRLGANQTYILAGVHASMGTLLAHYYRELSGKGQHVDVSIQECVADSLGELRAYWETGKQIIHRQGPWVQRGQAIPRSFHECKDGYITGGLGGQWSEATMKWMDEEGMAGDLTDERWREALLVTGKKALSQEEIDHISGILSAFLKKHSKFKLYEEAQSRHINWMPICTPKEVVENDQLAARNYFVKVEHPELGESITYPGAPYRLNQSWQIWSRAPLIGEHNLEIYQGELGFSDEELARLKTTGVI